MERVLEDLNFACEHCYTSSDWINCARINRYIALAYKARVCLFEGTYRKYHSVDPSTARHGKTSRLRRNSCANAPRPARN